LIETKLPNEIRLSAAEKPSHSFMAIDVPFLQKRGQTENTVLTAARTDGNFCLPGLSAVEDFYNM
jgi:hypothetical protein